MNWTSQLYSIFLALHASEKALLALTAILLILGGRLTISGLRKDRH